MRAGSRGYIIPDVPVSDGLLCLKVWIPNDPRYLEAFSGQYHDLGTWRLWEKDGTNRASLAASVWKDAIDYTYLNGWLNCGEEMECCTEILERLEAIEMAIGELDMTVTVTNNLGCGCGCGGSGGGGTTPPIEPGDFPPLPPSPVPQDPQEEDAAAWCDRATETAGRYVDAFVTLEQHWDGLEVTVDSVRDWLEEKFGSLGYFWGWVLNIVAQMLILAMQNLWENDASEAAASMRDDLICAVYNADSPAAAKSAFESEISKGTQGLNIVVRTLMMYIAWVIDWNVVFDLETYAIGGVYDGSDCSMCGGDGGGGEELPAEPIDIGEDYWLVPCNVEEYSDVADPDDLSWEWLNEANGVLRFISNPDNTHLRIGTFTLVSDFVDSAYGEWDLLYPFVQGFAIEEIAIEDSLAMSVWLAGGSTYNGGSGALNTLAGLWSYGSHLGSESPIKMALKETLENLGGAYDIGVSGAPSPAKRFLKFGMYGGNHILRVWLCVPGSILA